MRSRQVLRRQIRDAACVLPAVVLHARDAALEEAVADGQGEGDVEIVSCRGNVEPTHSAAKIVAERLLDRVGCETSSDIFG